MLLSFSILNLGGDDAGVARLELFRILVEVLVGGNELSLVVGASITNNNLGGVFIWHHDCWLWESASESIGMVWLQWFLEHASVEIISHLKLVL